MNFLHEGDQKKIFDQMFFFCANINKLSLKKTLYLNVLICQLLGYDSNNNVVKKNVSYENPFF